MLDSEKKGQKAKNSIDTFSEKRPRGRPGVRASEVAARSHQYHVIFNQIWDSAGERLLKAETPEDVMGVFESSPSYQAEFKGIASLILAVVRDRHFPKERDARVNFLADSLAARGKASPRRSRDICGEGRARERRLGKHQILRREFYIECSCGYKGPARDNACRRCGAQIPPSLASKWLGA